MKKVTAIFSVLTAAALLASLTGCNGGTSDASGDSGNSSVVSDSTGNSDSEGANTSDNSDNSDTVPEKKTPEGEPTFLICPDGTPIYTSEITKYQNPSEFHGTHEQYPLDTFNMETFTGVDFPEIVCEGFAYAFIPRVSVNVYENPEKFTESGDIRVYSGEELPPGNEYFRIKVGDKFGGLTVKSAQARFSNDKAYWYDGDPNAVPGIYLTGAEIEYEGEVEMTGYIVVMKTEGYETEGNLWFYPTGDCVTNIPAALYQLDSNTPALGACYYADRRDGLYGDLAEITLGNMYDFDIDFDGLKPGDHARVKLTVKDPIVSARDGFMWCNGEPAVVEVLK